MDVMQTPQIKHVINGTMRRATLLSEGLIAIIPTYTNMAVGDEVHLHYRIHPDYNHEFGNYTTVRSIEPLEIRVAKEHFNTEHPDVAVWYEVRKGADTATSEHVTFKISDR